MDALKDKVGGIFSSLFRQDLTDLSKTPGAGGHRNSGSISLVAIGATLIPTLVTAAAFLLGFVLLRSRYRNIYAPRTYYRTISRKWVSQVFSQNNG